MVGDYEKQDNTSFNMALPTLNRIHNNLEALRVYYIEGRPMFIKRHLIELFKEINPFLNGEEKQTAKSEVEYIRANIYFEGATLVHAKDILARMFDFELWLRDKLKEKGLLMAMADDVEEAVLG